MNAITDDLAFAAVRAPVAAAIAAAQFTGRGDERAADQAAVDAMRAALNALPIKGRVVIGEGERDEAPMLYVGEEVGKGVGHALDIALDPLEGTTLAAKAKSNAMSVIALAPKGGLLHAPDTYMDKLAIGPGYEEGVVDLDKPVEQNVRALARAKGVTVQDIGVCVLDRPRHGGIIEALRTVGARVHLIGDGDIAGVINCTNPETGIDMYVGSGGAPEGVLAAAALKCVGGQFQGRLVIRNDEERQRAEHAGIGDLKRRYTLDELVSADAIFIATGVTTGSLLDGVKSVAGIVHTNSIVMNSATRTVADLRLKQPVA
ncbi:class II fructose-bisphosphatase [Vitreimonas sp.]|jgi:fructose-1,6-bisphosphatase II / sedoheptulose-1,7-bisphosphatase|uniref:class II fructose-bisphosphatase n=1 Tax=Vitreimonas sp. TaxID=3069702 RepID=UPI002EDA1FB1